MACKTPFADAVTPIRGGGEAKSSGKKFDVDLTPRQKSLFHEKRYGSK